MHRLARLRDLLRRPAPDIDQRCGQPARRSRDRAHEPQRRQTPPVRQHHLGRPASPAMIGHALPHDVGPRGLGQPPGQELPRGGLAVGAGEASPAGAQRGVVLGDPARGPDAAHRLAQPRHPVHRLAPALPAGHSIGRTAGGTQMTDPRQLAAALEAELPDILALTERVVNIDSGTYHAAGVNAVIDIWANVLLASGFDISRQPLQNRGDQLTARRMFGAGRRVLILGHADTVWPAGTVAEWPFRRDNGWITGPGVGDMKSCVVTALHALRLA